MTVFCLLQNLQNFTPNATFSIGVDHRMSFDLLKGIIRYTQFKL